jgi:hypothetical protein
MAMQRYFGEKLDVGKWMSISGKCWFIIILIHSHHIQKKEFKEKREWEDIVESIPCQGHELGFGLLLVL